MEFILVGGFEGVKLGLFFRGDDDRVGGGKAVFGGVFGGGGFSVWGAGAGGELGVELVSVDLCDGGHLGAPFGWGIPGLDRGVRFRLGNAKGSRGGLPFFLLSV